MSNKVLGAEHFSTDTTGQIYITNRIFIVYSDYAFKIVFVEVTYFAIPVKLRISCIRILKFIIETTSRL